MSRNQTQMLGLIIILGFMFAILLLIVLNPSIVDSFIAMFDKLQETVGVVGTWAIVIVIAVLFAFLIALSVLRRPH